VTEYDRVPYPTRSLRQAQPDRLATIATLFGMEPPPVERCRVLELGCGEGANATAMAFHAPGSEIVGIDISTAAIARARVAAEALGFSNVTFRHVDIMDLSLEAAPFDYIIAHGVYSWVEAPVRDRLLAICRALLGPHGVAFVSYNTLPGYHVAGMLREMMLFHVRGTEDPRKRVAQAVALVRFLAESKDEPDLYRLVLRQELESLSSRPASTVHHDLLAPTNDPVYFHEFVGHAAQHGLQYLGEADYFEMFPHGYAAGVAERMGSPSGHRIAWEQYLDFLKCRLFRQTLLCHESVPLRTDAAGERVSRFRISSSARCAIPDPGVDAGAPALFQGARGARLETAEPMVKAAMMLLAERWPESPTFDELLAGSRSRIGRGEGDAARAGEADARELGDGLLMAYSIGLVELHLQPSRAVSRAGPRPLASALARWQAHQGPTVTTLRGEHALVEDDLERHLIPLLDGTRGRSELLEAVTAPLGARAGAADTGDGAAGAQREPLTPVWLERVLTDLARLALLEA